MPEGRWRVLALGGVGQASHYNVDPIQRIYLRRIAEQSEGGPLEQQDLPLGETFDLFSGAGLADGIRDATLDGDLRPFTLKVEVTRSAMEIVRRSDRDPNSGEFIIPWRADVSETSDLYMAVLRDAQDRWQAVVPCAELFRFYYLTSSRLGRTILSPDMLEASRTLFSENGTRAPDAAGHMKLVVRRGVLPSDVPVIARWLASPNRYGLRAAEQIARHQTKQARLSSEPVPLRVLPPFEGTCTWSVLGQQVRRGDRMYVFICKLISCDAPFGYETLEWKFDDERTPSDSVNPDQGETEPPKLAKSSIFVDDEPLDFVYLDGDSRPSSRFVSRLVPLDDLKKRFTSLNVEGVTRKKPDSSLSRNSRPPVTAVPKVAGALNAGAPSAGGDTDTQAVEFTATHPSLTDTDSDSNGVDSSLSPRQALQLILDICDAIAARRVTCRDRINDTARCASLFGRFFNLFPDTIARPRRRFLYLDEERTKPRPIYIVEFEQAKKFGYLLEIPRKPGEKFSTLLFREIRNARIQESILAALLEEVGKKESVGISEEVLSLWGLVAKRSLHVPQTEVEQRATDFLVFLQVGLVDSSPTEAALRI